MAPKKIIPVESDVNVVPVKQTKTKKTIPNNEELIETDKELIETNKKLIKTNKKSIKTDKESIKTDKETVKADKELVKADKETVKSDKVLVKADKELIITDKKTREKKVILNKANKVVAEPAKKTKKGILTDAVEIESTVLIKENKTLIDNIIIEPLEKNQKISADKVILHEKSNEKYGILKARWAILCEKIIFLNKERDTFEIEKDEILSELWKLGEDTKPKDVNLYTLENIRPVGVSNSKVLEDSSGSDSDESDSSESGSDSDSDEEVDVPKVVRKSSSKVSDSSDSD